MFFCCTLTLLQEVWALGNSNRQRWHPRSDAGELLVQPVRNCGLGTFNWLAGDRKPEVVLTSQ